MSRMSEQTYEDENVQTQNFNVQKAALEPAKNEADSPKRFVEVPLDNFLSFAGFAKIENQENNSQNAQMHFKNMMRTHERKNINTCGYYMSDSVMMRVKRNLLQKAEQRRMLLQLRISNVNETTCKDDASEPNPRAKLRYKQLVHKNKKVDFTK